MRGEREREREWGWAPTLNPRARVPPFSFLPPFSLDHRRRPRRVPAPAREHRTPTPRESRPSPQWGVTVACLASMSLPLVSQPLLPARSYSSFPSLFSSSLRTVELGLGEVAAAAGGGREVRAAQVLARKGLLVDRRLAVLEGGAHVELCEKERREKRFGGDDEEREERRKRESERRSLFSRFSGPALSLSFSHLHPPPLPAGSGLRTRAPQPLAWTGQSPRRVRRGGG